MGKCLKSTKYIFFFWVSAVGILQVYGVAIGIGGDCHKGETHLQPRQSVDFIILGLQKFYQNSIYFQINFRFLTSGD